MGVSYERGTPVRTVPITVARVNRSRELFDPLGPLGFEGAQHRQTLRPSVDGVRSKALRPFDMQ